MPALVTLSPSSPRPGSMVTDHYFSLRNQASDPKRNLKSNVSNQSGYGPASSQLGQLSLTPDLHSAAGLQHQFQPPYPYVQTAHEPSPFYATQTYRPQQLQTSLPGPQQQYVQHQAQQQPSPSDSRKRRASELDAVLPGSAGSSTGASAFTHHSGMMGAPGELDMSVASQQQQQQQQQQHQQQQQSMPSPVVKKGRTNTPWTPAEEHKLKQLRDGGNSWSEIAKNFPQRTEGSVKKHWYKDMHYADFADDESQTLMQAIKDYENNKWKVIGAKVGKPAKACEQFAKEQGWKV